MKDVAHELTDDILRKLEKDLVNTYNSAFKSAKKELEVVNDTLDKYKDTMTPQDRIKLWNKRDRLDKLITTLTIDIADANITATKMINDDMLNVFDLNYSYGAYKVETLSGYEVYSNLYNRSTIKQLLLDNENPFTKIAIDDIKDKTIIQALLRRQFAAAIINGETMKQISERVKGVMDKNLNDSTRIARTETTRIESMGRQDAFVKGEEMGLKLKKQWISTADKRTRESHLKMMLETVDLDKPFSNGLQFPCDISGNAAEVVNCRCSHIVEFVGVEKSAKLKELEASVNNMAFDEWKGRF